MSKEFVVGKFCGTGLFINIYLCIVFLEIVFLANFNLALRVLLNRRQTE